MSTIQELFQQAQLAEAAYASFFDDAGFLVTTDAQVKTALTIGGFSPSQADDFVAHWQVVDQYTAPSFLGLTGSGFSATVFQNIATGEYVFAARGTERSAIPTDWTTNLGDVGADGIAIEQGIDLFNYYQRLIGTSGTPVAQYQYIPSLHPDDPVHYPPQIVRIADAAAIGTLSTQPMITAVGHSLGGHLAMMLSRMTAHVNAVTTFNAPGFDSFLGQVTNPLTSDGFFSLLGAATGLDLMNNGWQPTSMTHLDVQGDTVHNIGMTPGSSQRACPEFCV
jgi:hypothetical protein